MGTINGSNTPERCRVGLIFDNRMCIHSSPDEKDHPENPNRIRAIWDRLNDSGLVQRCVVLDAKKAEDNHLALVHSRKHINLIKTISSRSSRTMSNSAAKFDSVYFNGGSSTAAYLAAGSVIEVAERVAKGELDSAFAVVRPPGHHAEQDKPMGFCLCNNVAIATSFLLNERPELGMSKILIVDWDIHHGNGTQKMFYDDPRVLVFSVHRHESGRFYPHGIDGSYNMIGEGQGVGYNINVPWENGGCGDADYIAVWDHILIPVAKEFNPDMIIISAGFDAAKGDPIGGCCVSSYGYMVMLDKLMGFARGKIVMALEGGYNPVSLADSTQSCIEVLLQEKPVISSLEDVPLKSTWCVIRAVRQALCRYWPELAATLPDNLINRRPSQIEADAAIQDEVDFREQAYEKLSNKGDRGIQILASGMNAEAFACMLGANPQVQQQQQVRPPNAPRGRGNRRGTGRGHSGAHGAAGNEAPPRGPIEDLTVEGARGATPPSAAPEGPISLSSSGSRNRSGELALFHDMIRADRQGKRKRLPDSIPISGKGKEVVVGHRGEGSDTSSSEDEDFWKMGCRGDARYKCQRTEGPVLLKKNTYSVNLVSDIVGKLQFSGDHDKLNEHDASRVADDACHVLLTEVIPRLKNLQGRALAYSEHKAKYKKLLRVSDPGQLQEDYNNISAQLNEANLEKDKLKESLRQADDAYVILDDRHKKLKQERDQLKDQTGELGRQLAESTRQSEEAKKTLAELQEVAGLEERVAWDAVLKFVRSKAFAFAANMHCFDNARRFFYKAIGQMVKVGLAPESARTDDRLRMDLDDNCEPMVQDEDPSESLVEPEYQGLVMML